MKTFLAMNTILAIIIIITLLAICFVEFNFQPFIKLYNLIIKSTPEQRTAFLTIEAFMFFIGVTNE